MGTGIEDYSDPGSCEMAAGALDERKVEHRNFPTDSFHIHDEDMVAKKVKSAVKYFVVNERFFISEESPNGLLPK